MKISHLTSDIVGILKWPYFLVTSIPSIILFNTHQRDDIARHRKELGLGRDPFDDLVEVRSHDKPGKLFKTFYSFVADIKTTSCPVFKFQLCACCRNKFIGSEWHIELIFVVPAKQRAKKGSLRLSICSIFFAGTTCIMGNASYTVS